MSAADTLFQRILSDPQDDNLRRQYADATDDAAHAEFIRLQLRNPTSEFGPRERALIIANRARWIAPLGGVEKATSFRRGFIDYVSIDARAWLTHHDRVVATVPLLDLRLPGIKGVVADVFSSPVLARLRSLDLRMTDLDDADVTVLAACPHLSNLKWLDLTGNRVGRAGLEALAASTRLPGLRWLGFRGNIAPDPVPVPYLDGTVLNGFEVPPIHDELVARYGPRPWLEGRARMPRPQDL